MPSYAICVSVWYEKWQFLGLKLLNFCHFRSFDNHETDYKAFKIAKETSAATLRPKKHKNKKLLVSTKIPLCYPYEMSRKRGTYFLILWYVVVRN